MATNKKFKSVYEWKNETIKGFINKKESQFMFNGVYYPVHHDIRVVTDGRRMFLDGHIFPQFKRTGIINEISSDLIGAEKRIEGDFPDFLNVLPKKITRTFEVTIPDFIQYVKNHDSITFDFKKGVFTHEQIPFCDGIIIKMEYLKPLHGLTVTLGIESTEEPSAVAFWESDASYNPTHADWTYIIMPMKPNENREKPIKELHIVSGGLERSA